MITLYKTTSVRPILNQFRKLYNAVDSVIHLSNSRGQAFFNLVHKSVHIINARYKRNFFSKGFSSPLGCTHYGNDMLMTVCFLSRQYPKRLPAQNKKTKLSNCLSRHLGFQRKWCCRHCCGSEANPRRPILGFLFS